MGRGVACGTKVLLRCRARIPLKTRSNYTLFSPFSKFAGKEDFFMLTETTDNKFASIFSIKYWRSAADQFKDVRMITVAALIVALRVAVKFVRIPIAQGLAISLDGYVNSLGSVIYGPLVGLLVGAISDTLGCLITGRMGEYFPPFVLTEMLSSFIFGLFFWKRKIRISSALSAKFTVNFVCNIILTSLFNKWMYYLYYGLERAEAYNIINGVRIAKNLVMFPLEATIIVIVLSATLPMLTKLGLVDKNYCFVYRPSNKKLALEVILFTLLSVAIILLYIFVFKDIIADLNLNIW